MSRVQDILTVFEKEKSKASNFRTLFQKVADLIYPRRDQITEKDFPGEEKTNRLVDTTAVMASMEMASGLSQNLVPPGQRFFTLEASDGELNDIEIVKDFFSDATNILHEHLFASNFMTEFNSLLRSLVVFGTGNLYSEFTTELNFREYDIGSYLILENSKRIVDTMMMEFTLTARQAFERWKNKAGKTILDANASLKSTNEEFVFLQIVQPRANTVSFARDNLNMPFESVILEIKGKHIIEEGGFEEFPFHVPRWTKAPNEVWGRGQGTFILPDVRMLQRMKIDVIEAANKQVNPPLEVLDSYEGNPNMGANAINWVQQLGSIKAVERNALGNFAIGAEVVEAQQDLIRKAFFNDVFVQISNLKGDRRTTVEIQALLLEGLQRLGPPIGRINSELFNPLIKRVFLLLLRNGQMPEVPIELSGQNFKVEYISRLALQLKSHQARGFQEWFMTLAEMETVVPGTIDNANVDEGARDLGRTFGVSSDNIASLEEVEAKREARRQAEQAAALAQAAEVASGAYKDTSKAPEAGSPAEGVMEAIGA